jgi:hypothetical protein
MDLLETARLQAFLLFAVPGIVALYVRTQFLTGRMPPLNEGLVAYVTVSLVYHALAFPFAPDVYARSPTQGGWSLTWLIFAFGIPIVVGGVLGLDARYGWTSNLMLKLKLVTTHPIGSAWDWRFSGIAECWVLIVLKNGIKWGGCLGTHSFVSSDPAERDIYVQQVSRSKRMGLGKLGLAVFGSLTARFNLSSFGQKRRR